MDTSETSLNLKFDPRDFFYLLLNIFKNWIVGAISAVYIWDNGNKSLPFSVCPSVFLDSYTWKKPIQKTRKKFISSIKERLFGIKSTFYLRCDLMERLLIIQ